MKLIKELHQYLSVEINQMNDLIGENIAVKEELIQSVTNHLNLAGGKRIRPMLTLLTSKMLGAQGDNAIRLATAIEFIHMATLLHDDVVDESTVRRFAPTANILWGNKASILVGDFLFSQSFKLIVSTKMLEALEILSHASAVISEGEVAQLSRLVGKEFISKADYYQLIEAKTAELFSAACQVGAIVSHKPQYANNLKNFGLLLGIAFQISDDMLDYFDNQKAVGKNPGDDFFEGKITLPVIVMAEKLSTEEQEKLYNLFKAASRSEQDFAWVKDLMAKHRVTDAIFQELGQVKNQALQELEPIPYAGSAKDHLMTLLDFSVNRIH